MRLFFATDIHGSETCWRKFLNSGKHYAADALVLGGDMTGKALVPIVDDGGGHWHATLLENRHELQGEEEVVEFETLLRTSEGRWASRPVLVATFLAILELARISALRIFQSRNDAGAPEGPIRLRRAGEGDPRERLVEAV